MNRFVQESPTGAVPNYYYNVLSQQYMFLSEKLLAEPTDAELEGLDLRTKVLVTARVAAQEELDLKLKEAETTSQSQARFVPDEEKAPEDTSPKNITSQPDELEVSSVPQDIDLDIDQDKEIHIMLPSTKSGSTSTAQLGTIHLLETEEVSNKTQDIVLDTEQTDVIQVKLPPITLDFMSTTQLSTIHKLKPEEVSSMSQDADLDTEQEEEVHVKLPTTLGIGSTTQLDTTDELKTENTAISQAVLNNPSSLRSGNVPESTNTGYWVEMQNVKPMTMHIRNKAEKFRALTKILAENKLRISCIRQLQDITYVGWIRHDSPGKLVSAVLVEFRTAQQANEAIDLGIAYEGIVFDCRKYHRDCKPVQCTRCQVYGHADMHCTSLLRCAICSGRHLAIKCSSTVELCALCGGGHRADNLSCPKLAAAISRVNQALNADRSRLWLPGGDLINEVSSADSRSNETVLLPQQDHPTPRQASKRTLPGLSFQQFLAQSKTAYVAQNSRSRATDLTLRGGSQTRASAARATKRAQARALNIGFLTREIMMAKERLRAVSGNHPKAENIAKPAKAIEQANARALKIDSRPIETLTAKESLEVVDDNPTHAEKICRRESKRKEWRSNLISPSTQESQEKLNSVAEPTFVPDKPTTVVPVNSWDSTTAEEETNW